MTEPKVSEPTRIEIETWLVEIAEYMEGGLGWTKSDERMANAIRAAIEEMRKWQRQAGRIMSFGKNEGKRLLELEELARSIRDFKLDGEEKPAPPAKGK